MPHGSASAQALGATHTGLYTRVGRGVYIEFVYTYVCVCIYTCICICIYTRGRAHGDIHRLFQHALIVELHLARKGMTVTTTGPSPG